MTADDPIRRSILEEGERVKPQPPKVRPRSTDKLGDYRDRWMNTDQDGPRSFEPEVV